MAWPLTCLKINLQGYVVLGFNVPVNFSVMSVGAYASWMLTSILWCKHVLLKDTTRTEKDSLLYRGLKHKSE